MTIVITIACILAVIFALAALGNKQLNIERSVVINKPTDEVFSVIRLLRNHDKFNMWMMMDPDMKKEFRGTDGEVGFVYAWDSANQRNVGAGEQKIISIETNRSIAYELKFIRPMQDIAAVAMQTNDLPDGKTQVTWGFNSTMKFPMNVMKPLMKKMLGKSLDQSLNNLKTLIEQ
ncbi:MAG: SRPBCC family protein [Flavipsychrobacter sp.]|nr:SRPBCC family protein [Flavipsychrobacter sp.]